MAQGRLTSPARQRHGNYERVLRYLIDHGASSLDEIVKGTELSKGTVFAALGPDGPLKEVLANPVAVRMMDGPGGRATTYFNIKPYVAIGVSFEHDRVEVCVTDIRGVELCKQRAKLTVVGSEIVPTLTGTQDRVRLPRLRLEGEPADDSARRAPVDHYPQQALDYAERLVRLALDWLGEIEHAPFFWSDAQHPALLRSSRREPVTYDDVVGIGVALAVAAPVDLETEQTAVRNDKHRPTASARNLPAWESLRPAELLLDRLDLDPRVCVKVGNNANLGAWAEYKRAEREDSPYGCTGAPRSLLYVHTSSGASGVGAGIVFRSTRGQVSTYRGANKAGEIGHLPADLVGLQPKDGDEDIEPCAYCGRTDCLEVRSAVNRFLPEEAYATWDDVIHELRDNRGLDERAGSLEAKAVIRASALLGRALGLAVTLLNPDVIVIGGPLSHVLDDGRVADEGAIPGLKLKGDDVALITEMQKVATADAMESLRRGDDANHLAVYSSEIGWQSVALGAAIRVIDVDTELVKFFAPLIG